MRLWTALLCFAATYAAALEVASVHTPRRIVHVRKRHHRRSIHERALHEGAALSRAPPRGVQPFAAPRWVPAGGAANDADADAVLDAFSAQPVQLVASQAGAAAAAVPSIDASEAKAALAATQAATAVKEIAAISTANNEFQGQAQAQAAEAKVALQTAQEAAVEAKTILAETKVAAEQAAKTAAAKYYNEVKIAAGAALKASADARAKALKAAALGKAKAGLAAAEPFYNAMLRGQKVLVEYQTRAQELGAVANNLKSQAFVLAHMANGYQHVGQTNQARQIMAQAHALMNEAERAQSEAKRLRGVEEQINGLIPAYNEAANAALNNAKATFTGVDVPEQMVPY